MELYSGAEVSMDPLLCASVCMHVLGFRCCFTYLLSPPGATHGGLAE